MSPRLPALIAALVLVIGTATVAELTPPVPADAVTATEAGPVRLSAPTTTPVVVPGPVDWSGLQSALQARTLWYATVVWNNAVAARRQSARIGTSVRRGGAQPSGGSHRGYSTAKECVANTENGGSYDRGGNPTHAQKYQFSYSTWVAYGGDPDTWGHASPAEQEAVFERAWASPGGPGNWLPYDHCG